MTRIEDGSSQASSWREVVLKSGKIEVTTGRLVGIKYPKDLTNEQILQLRQEYVATLKQD